MFQEEKTRKVGVTPIFTRNHNSTARILVNVGGSGSSKCFARGTKVVMFDGSLRHIEEIEQGDFVMGVDSSSREVLEVHSGVGELYCVEQSKAVNYTTNKEHTLVLKRSKAARQDGRYPQYESHLEISIADYLSKSKRFKQNFFGFRITVEFPSKPISIEPYFLGLWLGDGDSNRPCITTADQEVVQYLSDFALREKIGCRLIAQKGKAKSYLLTNGNCSGVGRHKNPITNKLNQYGLLKNKHIPSAFLYNTTENRLQLLAGIIDSDGGLHSNGFTIVQKRRELAQQIRFLAASLGFRTSLKPREVTCQVEGFKGKAYAVAIYGKVDTIPTQVKHKIAKVGRQIESDINGIRKITSIGVGEYFGFSLDKDGLFLLEDFTVVHNSHSVAQLFIEKFFNEEDKQFLIARKTMPALKRSAYGLILDLMKEYGLYERVEHNKTDNILKYRTNEMWFLGLDEPTKAKSISRGASYIWLEEADEFNYDDFLAFKLQLRRQTGKELNQMFLSFNPIDGSGWIPTRLIPQDDVEVIHSTVLDNPFVDKAYKESLMKLAGEDENYYRVYVLGEWGRLENLIFPNYKLVDSLPTEFSSWCYGLDFGFTHNTAMIKVLISGEKLYWHECICRPGMTNSDLIERLSHFERADIYADNQEPQRIAEIQRAGYTCLPANKDVKMGIDICRRHPIHITKDSINIIKEIRGYQRKKDKNGVILEDPVKAKDDTMDAGRYGSMGIVEKFGYPTQAPRPSEPIKSLESGEKNNEDVIKRWMKRL